MIVIDTNILVHLTIESELTASARSLESMVGEGSQAP